MNESRERYPIHEAQQVISDRVTSGSSVLGIAGVWVVGDDVRPDPQYVADLDPGGSNDPAALADLLAGWPQDESFCVEIEFARPH